MIEDLSARESEEDAARDKLVTCRAFIDELPDDAVLEVAPSRSPIGLYLDGVALRPLGGARSLCLGDPYAENHLGRQGKGIFAKRRRLPL